MIASIEKLNVEQADRMFSLTATIEALKDDLRKMQGSNTFFEVALRGLHNREIRKAVHGKDEIDDIVSIHDKLRHGEDLWHEQKNPR